MTQDEIIEMARQAGMDYLQYISPEAFEKVVAFTKLVAQHEREACAKLCFEMWDKWMDADPSERDNLPRDAEDCASAIRSRGQA
jgi:hypothetical protein